MNREEQFLTVQDLSKRYGRIRALNKLSFSIPRNVTAAFIGANGAGKTTTFSLIGRFIRPDSGEIRIDGMDLHEYRSSGGLIGLLPQDMQYYEERSVMRQLSLFAELSGLPRKEARSEAERVLELVQLSDRATAKVEQLSRGMKVRLGVAQALIAQPQLILLDEPMAGLDPKMRANFRGIIEEIKGKATIIISSHELGELQTLCDYVCMIEKGALVQQGRMSQILSGSSQVLYHLSSPNFDYSLFQKQYPEFSCHFSSDGILKVEFSEEKTSLEELNKKILGWLLEHDIGVVKVEREESLEDIYLRITDKTPEE